MRAKRLGILGGSFNPVHCGHLAMGHSAAEAFHLERVLMMPCALSPFKIGAFHMASAEDRAEMVRRAIHGDPLFFFCGMELERGGISYAVDSVRALRSAYPGTDFFFIIGMDSLLGLSGWREADTLLELCEFIPVCRPGVDMPSPENLRFPLPVAERLLRNVIQGQMRDVSSSEIRSRLTNGLPVTGLVPPSVEQYIAERGLYHGEERLRPSSVLPARQGGGG